MTTSHQPLVPRRPGAVRGDRGGRTAVIAFRAFRDLYRDAYLAYATARLGSHGPAEQVVDDTLTALAVHWSSALGCSHPAAVAWRLLSSCVDAANGSPPRCPAGRPCAADAHVLRCHLRMESTRAAELMGLSHGEFLVALRDAADPLPGACSCHIRRARGVMV
ncbi:hypothetical protein EES43_00190 [Streptomyces sp. ADI96-02]|uniref:hypothetical protein n=1 Tax=unclassified Streptomyces TaxID=2593676 RepID=UPI000F9CE513|nr:hypothetical protein [Streptomyces sp. ADI96-02]RPK69221.1 hypothetical protein EES43_00190 [Streptomyces sp. ADI96-02]